MTTKKPSLATTICQGRISLTSCVYNASGPRTGSSAALAKIAKSEAGGILAKSATVESQTGNPQPRTWQSESASLNSEGLPNYGIGYYLSDDVINEVKASGGDKPYMVSISGKNLQDNLTMLSDIVKAHKENKSSISAVELNLACPNVIGHPIIAYDFKQMEEVLNAVSSLMKKSKSDLPLGVKMPPYFDGPHFQNAANIINKYVGIVSYVASINTIGNAFAVDTHSEMPVISSKGGLAGLSGPAVKHTALANVKVLRSLLNPDIDVIGVGGVSTGEDVFQMILVGASAVQVGTCHWIEGPSCFGRISDELIEIMNEKGYSTIEEFRGKLRDWSKEGASASRAARKAREAREKEEKEANDLLKQAKPNLFDIVNLVLIAIIAMLAADKFGIMS